ncbi:MBL fold metallo-hydrolase [Oceanospirillum maris]|jgi:glyoxylase-like metal-dependent hydrolase (beta-lactamase superfamily II)|uniref:MBL fold metallo-hydrolase n=1 Tax=Oceanospirillum maris TaxID=64977 RepID=UPI000427F848|nr:MBL fold metallo-hydrolase [Oceanospirillum maris]
MEYEIIPVTGFQQNCTLVWCSKTKEAAVIDPGGDQDKILARVDALQLALTQIWLTHGHIDHAGATGDLAEKLNLPIIGPQKNDAFWIEALAQQSQMFGFPAAKPFTPSRWLEDGDTVQVGEQVFQVLHCPGHTPGHVVFYHADTQLAQVGDVLFQGSIGRTDFPQGNHDDLIRSIREKLFPLGDDVRFIPGHGAMSNFGRERTSNPFCGDARS